VCVSINLVFFLCFLLYFFQGLVEKLDSKDWTKVCESLNDVRRFVLYHSLLLLPILYVLLLFFFLNLFGIFDSFSSVLIMGLWLNMLL
jgi:hypothetical protein